MTFQKGNTINLGRKESGFFGKKHTKQWQNEHSIQMKGHIVSQGTRNKISKALQEENCWAWKGNKVKKGALHQWVYKYKGKPKICKYCGKKGKKVNGHWNLDWANKDHKYKRNLNDYVSLCRFCHKKYDLNKIKII